MPGSDAPLTDDELVVRALRAARQAGRRGEVPIGALAVLENRIIAAAGNRVEATGDATAHAEMLVLRSASRVLGGWRLDGVTLVATLEPCPMCAGAMLLARVERCVYGARDPRKGADGSAYDVLRRAAGNHRITVVSGIQEDACADVLRAFFREARARDGTDGGPAGRS